MAIEPLAPQAYTDLNGLAALKRGAKAQTPEALREAARQFESIFTRMMLKSMREASSGDELFGSQQSGFYRDMFDDQIAVDMSRGHGLGLAEQLVTQMLRAGMVGKQSVESPPAETPKATEPLTFIKQLMPNAIAAGKQLGVDPQTLLAHAALESGWGKSLPTAVDGRSSNNLFGVKAGARWRGEAVSARTVEYDQGAATHPTLSFRAYRTPQASFQDYVALLRDNPRYAAALGRGADAAGFAQALQQAGYATDPRYAEKLVAVVRQVRDVVATSLKSSAAAPIPSSQASG